MGQSVPKLFLLAEPSQGVGATWEGTRKTGNSSFGNLFRGHTEEMNKQTTILNDLLFLLHWIHSDKQFYAQGEMVSLWPTVKENFLKSLRDGRKLAWVLCVKVPYRHTLRQEVGMTWMAEREEMDKEAFCWAFAKTEKLIEKHRIGQSMKFRPR